MSMVLDWVGSSAPSGDPYFANVVLLLNMAGANGATTFTDESLSAHTITNHGSTALSNVTSPLGGTSLSLNGTSQYLTAPDSDDWYWPGEFTVEAWVYRQGNGPRHILAQRTGVNSNMLLEIDVSGVVGFQMPLASGAIGLGDVGVLGSSAWAFVAVDRDATGKARLYMNGAMVSSDTDAALGTNMTYLLGIGANETGGNPWDGNIGPVRITKGVARYASDSGHAVPTAIFPTIPTLPVFSAAPAISSANGFYGVGDTLTAITGTYSSYGTTTWQWLADGLPISGATSSSFTLTSSELGAIITVMQAVTNGAGVAYSTSSGVGPVATPAFSTTNRKTSDGADRLTSTGDTRVTTVRTA